jgi:hypothetical protein
MSGQGLRIEDLACGVKCAVTFGMLEAKLLCGERCYGHLIPAPHGGGAAGAAQGATDNTVQVMDAMFSRLLGQV